MSDYCKIQGDDTEVPFSLMYGIGPVPDYKSLAELHRMAGRLEALFQRCTVELMRFHELS